MSDSYWHRTVVEYSKNATDAECEFYQYQPDHSISPKTPSFTVYVDNRAWAITVSRHVIVDYSY